MIDVLQAFLEHKSRKRGNVSTDGIRLLSYGWYELAKWIDGQIVVRTGTLYSQSTKVQRTKMRLYRWQQASVPTPTHQGDMNV